MVEDRNRDRAAAGMSAGRARAVRDMFGRIAAVYDRMNHLLSLNLDRRWRRRLAERLDEDAWEVLDLCAGTGDLSLDILAAGRGRLVLGADFCRPMLARAAAKARRPAAGASPAIPRRLALLAADALALPLPDGAVDAVTVGFGVRNLADLQGGLAEMTRVLRPGGQLLVLDFFRDDPDATGPWRGAPPAVRRLLDALLPPAGRLLARAGPAYAYLARSVAVFVTPSHLAGLLREAGYEEIFAERETLGVAHLVGGRRKL